MIAMRGRCGSRNTRLAFTIKKSDKLRPAALVMTHHPFPLPPSLHYTLPIVPIPFTIESHVASRPVKKANDCDVMHPVVMSVELCTLSPPGCYATKYQFHRLPRGTHSTMR